MKRWHFICRCGWHGELFGRISDRIREQVANHRASCAHARQHGILREVVS